MSPSNIIYLQLLKSATTNFGLAFYLNSNIRCDMCKQHEQLTEIVMLLMDSQQTLYSSDNVIGGDMFIQPLHKEDVEPASLSYKSSGYLKPASWSCASRRVTRRLTQDHDAGQDAV